MLDKKEYLLQSIIKAYIEHSEPIGSTQLKSMYDITYSPATIRAYFKKLGEEGFLAQEHISSGRTPTIEALRQYWSSRLNFNIESINFEALKYYAKKVGLSVFIKSYKFNKLVNVLNVENRYLILEFSTFSCSIKFYDALHRFLLDMIGLDVIDIVNISKDVGAYELSSTINRNLENRDFQIYNYKEFLSLVLNYDLNESKIDSFLSGEILDTLKDGIYFEKLFPSDYIGICHSWNKQDENIKMLVVGELPKDYEYFYEKISDI